MTFEDAKKKLIDSVKGEHKHPYTIFLTGPWGVGKTYLVKKELYESFEHDDLPIFGSISLLGRVSPKEFDEDLKAKFGILNPKSFKKLKGLHGSLAFGLPGGYSIEGKMGAEFENGETSFRNSVFTSHDLINSHCIVFFDDLERIGNSETFNQFLSALNVLQNTENQNLVIIVACNEDKMPAFVKEKYREIVAKMSDVLINVTTPCVEYGKELLGDFYEIIRSSVPNHMTNVFADMRVMGSVSEYWAILKKELPDANEDVKKDVLRSLTYWRVWDTKKSDFERKEKDILEIVDKYRESSRNKTPFPMNGEVLKFPIFLAQIQMIHCELCVFCFLPKAEIKKSRKSSRFSRGLNTATLTWIYRYSLL